MASRIYVKGLGTSSDRVRLLIEALTNHRDFEVFVDPSVGGAADSDFYHNAAAIVVVCGNLLNGDTSYSNNWVLYDLEYGSRPMIFAKIDPGVVLPDKLSKLSVFDLTGWTGGENSELAQLMNRLDYIVDHQLPYLFVQSLSPWVVKGAESAVDHIGELMTALRRLDVVLAEDDVQMQALGKTLRELGETYRVVKSVVEQFFAAGLNPDGIDGEAYARLERRRLAETIHNGRAHCLRIGARYYREGGIRQALESRADAEILAMADETFHELTISDHDMLAKMDLVGEGVTHESRAVVTLLMSGQETAARRRILQARDLLLPLEDKLDEAVARFMAIEASLGYAEDRAVEKEGVNVTIGTVNINGNNENCNIVVANLIKETELMVVAPGVPNDLREYLTNLEKAVAELTTRLPDEAAEYAASDLKELTKQATSDRPNKLLLARAADSLINMAKSVAEIGLPVIDLVTRVVELLN
ncbi:hypothetical protein RCG71_18570 [Kocuria sp. CPCC 205281]